MTKLWGRNGNRNKPRDDIHGGISINKDFRWTDVESQQINRNQRDGNKWKLQN